MRGRETCVVLGGGNACGVCVCMVGGGGGLACKRQSLKWVVRILLECILVNSCVFNMVPTFQDRQNSLTFPVCFPILPVFL